MTEEAQLAVPFRARLATERSRILFLDPVRPSKVGIAVIVYLTTPTTNSGDVINAVTVRL